MIGANRGDTGVVDERRDEDDRVLGEHDDTHASVGPRRESFGIPPTRRPQHVMDVPSVEGRRVILMTPAGPLYDYRAASEVFTDDSGSWIKIVQEWRWYAWREMPEASRPEACPRARAWSTTNVWLD